MLTNFGLESPIRLHTDRMVDKGNRENCRGRGGRDYALVQHTATSVTVFIPGLNVHTSYRTKCFNCYKWGNYENQCPEPTGEETSNNSGQNMAQIGRCLTQGSSGGVVSDKWLLLDSCYTNRCSKKNSIVSNVTVSPLEEQLRIYSNGGHMEYTMSGTLDILSMGIYVIDNFIANIHSLKEVEDSFNVTMDTK